MTTDASPPTIGQIIDTIAAKMPPDPSAATVDTVKAGDIRQPLRGVVSTFMATRGVLDRARELGANLVVTHEPTFYQHADETDWLVGDPVYESKRAFLEQHGIVVWRMHDGIHRHRPDGIVAGVVQELGWGEAASGGSPNVYELPPRPLAELAEHCKARLGIAKVRVVGDPGMICSRVALLVGAYGGKRQIQLLGRPGVEVMICGESPEWETCEYVRDAAAAGQRKAFIALGHANSEEAGMKWFAEWLRPHVPAGIPITHVPAGDPFRFV